MRVCRPADNEEGWALPDELERRAAAPDRALPDRALPDRASPDRALPDGMLPDRALRRGWSAGDMIVRDGVAWGNRWQAGQGGLLHRVLPVERTAPHRMHCTISGAPELGL